MACNDEEEACNNEDTAKNSFMTFYNKVRNLIANMEEKILAINHLKNCITSFYFVTEGNLITWYNFQFYVIIISI